jgi:hypothetical protein
MDTQQPLNGFNPNGVARISQNSIQFQLPQLRRFRGFGNNIRDSPLYMITAGIPVKSKDFNLKAYALCPSILLVNPGKLCRNSKTAFSATTSQKCSPSTSPFNPFLIIQ